MYAGRIIVRVVFFPHYGSKGSFQYVSRDIFSLGFGPFRWVCTSGLSEDLRQTDAIATKVLQDIIKGLDKTSWLNLSDLIKKANEILFPKDSQFKNFLILKLKPFSFTI